MADTDKGSERGESAGERGPIKGSERGVDSPAPDNTTHALAESIFGQVAGLGGFMVVAMVTPMPAARSAPAPADYRRRAIAVVAEKAEARAREALAASQGEQEKNRAVLRSLAEAANAGRIRLQEV
jgi:hypothetical protein